MLGSVPGWGTKVPEATWQKRKKKVAQKHIHKWKRIDRILNNRIPTVVKVVL